MTRIARTTFYKPSTGNAMPKRKRKVKSDPYVDAFNKIINKLEPHLREARNSLLEVGLTLEITTDKYGTMDVLANRIPRRIEHKS